MPNPPIEIPSSTDGLGARVFGNWQTTLIGVLIAAGTYLQGVGTQLPSTGGDWATLIIGLLIAVGGALVKNSSFKIGGDK